MRHLKHLRTLFHATGAVFSLAMSSMAVLLVGSLLGLGFWVQSEGSLEQALSLLSSGLPSGQTLQVQEVRGNLRQGGHIGHMVWKKDALLVEAQDVELAWDWQSLLGRELKLQTLHVRRLHIDDHSPASSTPIADVVWPLRANVTFSVDQIDWVGPPALQLKAVQGHYRFDGTTHFLDQAALQMAQGSYQGSGTLQARAPMALALQVQGTVQTPLTLQKKVVVLTAQARASGTLQGPQAQLDLDMALQPQAPGKGQPLGAMQATLQAHIRPGAAQPIQSAQAQWTALDLATLWPQAPQTRLAGQAQVVPDADGWKAEVQVQNSLSGPLDRQRLPLNTAQAQVVYRQGQWMLSNLQAALAGGSVQAQGRYAGNPAQWSAQAHVQRINPAQLDTRLTLPVLQGDVAARQTPAGIAFETQLASALPTSAAAPDVQLQAKGQWQAPQLLLESLLLQTPQAKLSGQLQFNTQTYAGSGHLQGNAPGAVLALDGQLAETQGDGTGGLQVSDAHALVQWLTTLPVVGPQVGKADAQGAIDLSGQWTGGWHNQGERLQVQATLQSQRLDLQDKQLRDVRLVASGTLRTLALQLRGTLQAGSTELAVQAQAQGGQTSPGQWQARLNTLQAQAKNALAATPWTIDLSQPVMLDWRSTALAQSFSLAEGTLRLGGPAPGNALVTWKPAQWSHQGPPGGGAPARWNTQGQLQGLPLAWLELLGQTQLANLGLRGDVLFGGQWDASGAEALRLRANLQRSSGDLQMLGADAAGGALPAGLRDAHVTVEIDNETLRANLVWASDVGGNAEAAFSTRLQTAGGAIQWAADAPLQGQVHANLPRVGAWSLVAPVGWRIQGTLEADATLSGTRNNPSWKGSVQARDMSVRSVVDGIDFSNGVMRLQVDGQHLDIAELVLQGAGGTAGGRLTINGSADWLAAAAATPATNRLRMALEARAEHFRVSAKPDQRLVVSGNLSAQLNNARLVLRGALVADQALFVLPDDTAPKLGADVVVRRKPLPGKAKSDKAPAPAASSARLAQTVVPDISITLDPGSNFMLQGHGISTRLAGLLTLKAEGINATPRLQGELYTVAGTYRAYGQNLNIEQGTLRFSGAYDNPALDIRAVRPNLSQEVGVEISGTAQLPVVRLYADPDLPDADKLSWLVLGHGASTGGAETAMLQQAALALLAGTGKSPTSALVNAFGIDEVSLGQAATTNLDGTSGTETTVKLGKRISRDFYVAYERGISGTFGTFYVFYDLSRRFTLRGQSGTENAVDLIFTTRFD
jgi:translocation and assembly module TamB